MTCIRPHGESGKIGLRSWVPTSLPYFLPRLPVACFGIGCGGAGLGGPGVWAHFLPGPSQSSLPGTVSKVPGVHGQLLSASCGGVRNSGWRCDLGSPAGITCLSLMVELGQKLLSQLLL